MGYLFNNYATGRLVAALDAVDPTFALEAGQGANFPSPAGSDVFQAVIEDVDGNFEIVTVTQRVGDVFTVTRGQEGTAALNFVAGSVVELRVTKAALDNFLQRSGGIMAGAIDMAGNELQNAVLVAAVYSGGTMVGTILRAADNSATNQIEIPSGGADPLIGGNKIFHAGNDGVGSGLDADLVRGQAPLAGTRQVATPADGGLAGGGDLTADRSLTIDIANTVELAALPVYNDELLIRNTDGLRRVDLERIHGIAVSTQTVSYTLARGDANGMVEVDSASDRIITVPDNTTVPFPIGTIIALRRKGTGAVTVEAGAGVTIESPNGWLNIGTRYGMVALVKRGTNLWALEGRLAA